MSPKLTDSPQVSAQAAVEHLKSLDNLICLQSPQAAAEVKFGDVAYDSRRVTEQSAFVCMPGEKTDGNRFIEGALKLGARVIFSESAPPKAGEPGSDSCFVQVKQAHKALAQVADFVYGSPSARMRLIGVTGTNGKTTTTHLIEHILDSTGKKVGLIGTLGARTNVGSNDANGAGGAKGANGAYIDTKHTTPQASDLQKIFFDMEKSGVKYVTMEVSSHALALSRVAACNFSTIGLTNLTQDHLDFHKDMEHYFASKQLLFRQLNESKQANRTAVVNRDDQWAQRFIDSVDPGVKLLTYGWSDNADLYVQSADFDFSGTDLVLGGIFGTVKLKLRLNGRFNVYNVMAAILLCTAEGLTVRECIEALEKFDGVSGRFESVSAERKADGATVAQPLCLVDYAHTPDGLENVLKSARALVPPEGKLIAVFGCGGDRDATKRPQMGKIAETLADIVVVTSDNPRSEQPDKIIENILGGIANKSAAKIESDRARAIELAVELAGVNDVVVVAGKGHETYQILGDKTIDFDDRLVVKKALNARLSR